MLLYCNPLLDNVFNKVVIIYSIVYTFNNDNDNDQDHYSDNDDNNNNNSNKPEERDTHAQ